MTTTPLRTRFTAAIAAVRITYALLQVLAPLGGAAAAHADFPQPLALKRIEQ